MAYLSRSVLFALLLLGCGGAPATEGPAPAPTSDENGAGATAAPPALPAEIRAHVHLPGPDVEDNHVFVTVTLGELPWTISGCTTGAHGACEETSRVELDEASRAELVQLVAEVRAIPRCEPEGIFPGDRAYRLDLTSFPRPYEGNLPADPGQLATRNAGPCRADARLAWWIAEHFRSGA